MQPDHDTSDRISFIESFPRENERFSPFLWNSEMTIESFRKFQSIIMTGFILMSWDTAREKNVLFLEKCRVSKPEWQYFSSTPTASSSGEIMTRRRTWEKKRDKKKSIFHIDPISFCLKLSRKSIIGCTLTVRTSEQYWVHTRKKRKRWWWRWRYKKQSRICSCCLCSEITELKVWWCDGSIWMSCVHSNSSSSDSYSIKQQYNM